MGLAQLGTPETNKFCQQHMKVLFLCTANQHRSRTAEDFYRIKCPNYKFKSAGLSRKFCEKFGTTLCSEDMLAWADLTFVMEKRHKDRITEHTRDIHLFKISILNIDDIYKYMQPELIEILQSHEQLSFLNY